MFVVVGVGVVVGVVPAVALLLLLLLLLLFVVLLLLVLLCPLRADSKSPTGCVCRDFVGSRHGGDSATGSTQVS